MSSVTPASEELCHNVNAANNVSVKGIGGVALCHRQGVIQICKPDGTVHQEKLAPVSPLYL